MTSELTPGHTRIRFEVASEATWPSGGDTGNDRDDDLTPFRSTLTRLNGEQPRVLEDDWKGIAPHALAEFFNNVKYSDITIRLGETEVDLPAHRMVIGLQSPCLDKFIAKYPTGTPATLSWRDASAHSYWRIFHYLYQGDYSEDTAMALEGFNDEPDLLKHPRIFMLAGELEMSGLKALALKRFQSQLRGDWRVEDLVVCIEEIYENQNQHCPLLRPVIVEAASAYFLRRPVAPVFIKVLREIDDFRTDLMDLLAKRCHTCIDLCLN